MKIALINNFYEPVAKGGAENVVKKQAEILRKAGHQVVIVTTRPWGSKLPKSEDGIFRVGGFVGSFYHIGKLPKPLRLLWHTVSLCDFITPWIICLRLAFSRCDFAIGHNLTGMSLWLPMLLRDYHIPYIQVLHDVQYLHPSGLMFKNNESTINSPAAKLYQKITRTNMARAKAVISPSHWLAELFADLKMADLSKIHVLPNPIPEYQTNDASAAPSSKFRFLYVGQLEPHKGILELVNAFKKADIGAELQIVGDGSLVQEVKNAAAGYGNINLFGRLEPDKVKELMTRATVLAVPSLCYENQPVTILEAFASHLPVMGSAWSGTRELLDDGCGILIDPTDEAAFIRAIIATAKLDSARLNEYAKLASERLTKLQAEDYSKTLISLIDA